MRFPTPLRNRVAVGLALLVMGGGACAEPESRTAVVPSVIDANTLGELPQPARIESSTILQRAGASVQDAIDQALDLLGIPYRRGGANPAAGFDCSGFVSHVFREGLGLVLPHSSREISRAGDKVDRSDLQPGDLVFFNTMRKAFSHVGIYLGDGLFIHAPRAGERVRIEHLADKYWKKRYNGARRVEPD